MPDVSSPDNIYYFYQPESGRKTMYKNNLPSDSDFELLQQKLNLYKQLLSEIEIMIKRGTDPDIIKMTLNDAKIINAECTALKNKINERIMLSIN
jgi:hypothetical protein